MKIVFMGTPEFGVPALEALNDNYSVELVITQIDKPKGRGKKLQYPPIKTKALELGLEVYQPLKVNDDETIMKIKEINPDFIIVVAYGQILKKEILSLPKYGCINIHASLLPKYRGAAPINWAIINGEKETGITIMEMEEGLDTGDMIIKESIDISSEDDYFSIHDKLSIIGSHLIVKAIEDIKDGNASKVPQDHSLSSYAPMIYRDTGKIVWNRPCRDIINLVRGIGPLGAYTMYKREKLKVYKAKSLTATNNYKAGEIVMVNKEGIFVNAADGCIVIEELQFPGKKRMHVRDYLLGNSIDEGIILE